MHLFAPIVYVPAIGLLWRATGNLPRHKQAMILAGKPTHEIISSEVRGAYRLIAAGSLCAALSHAGDTAPSFYCTTCISVYVVACFSRFASGAQTTTRHVSSFRLGYVRRQHCVSKSLVQNRHLEQCKMEGVFTPAVQLFQSVSKSIWLHHKPVKTCTRFFLLKLRGFETR